MFVVDANGQRVGVLNSVSGIFVTAGGVTSLVSADRTGFTAIGTFGAFYYLTADCSDAPYATGSASSMFPLGRVANGLIWVADSTSPSRDLAFGDPVFVRNNVGTDPCAPATANTAGKLYLLQSYSVPAFVPPFRIE